MFARNVKWAALLLFAFALHTSCSQQDELAGEVTRGDEIVTAVSVNVPELFKTRAATLSDVYAGEGARYLGTSGMPSIGNVDLKEHPLTFTVGVYVKKKLGAEEGFALVDLQSHAAVEDDNAYFEFRLLKDQQYRLVAYADFNTAPKENLESISFATALNDELSDAFFASEDFYATENVQVVLKRPFGKLRLVAHDFNTFAAGEAFKINKVTVNYYRSPMLATDTFNALTGDFNYDADAQGDHTVEAVPVVYTSEYTDEGIAAVDENGKEGPVAVFTMYLPANFGEGGPLAADTTPGLNPDDAHVDKDAVPQSYYYPFDVTVEYQNANGNTNSGGTEVKTLKRSFTIDIPVKRNWLTTVDATNFWTDQSGIMVTVHAAFDGEIAVEEAEPVTVKTATELQTLITNTCTNAQNGKTTVAKFVLGADIDVTELTNGIIMLNTYPNDKYRTVEIHLDLNNHVIYNANEASKGIGSKGLVSIYSRNTILYIDDTSKEAKGGIEYRHPYPGEDYIGYPLISCVYGGQVVINRGNFKSTSTGPLVWVYESEGQRASTQIEILKALWETPEICPEEKPDFTLEENADKKKTIETMLKKLTSTATINGGWFENVIESSAVTIESSLVTQAYSVVINAYNVKKDKWPSYSGFAKSKGYPAWTDWGPYKNQIFGFVHINGGSFVEFDPSKGDNIVGNEPIKWIGEGHVQKEIINGKTVYTVIPKDVVHNF